MSARSRKVKLPKKRKPKTAHQTWDRMPSNPKTIVWDSFEIVKVKQ